MFRYTSVLAALLVAACTSPSPDHERFSRVATLLPEEAEAIDILFVIDDSASMLLEQEQIARWSERLFEVLSADGELPDVHIGVISSSVSIGDSVAQCSANADGRLQATPRSDCAGPEGAFLSDVRDGEGGRITNYSGSLADAFRCIAPVGIEGCGFEQPLEAIRRALDGSHPENEGFLRDEALLLVVIVSDEDDCSLADPLAFVADPDGSGELGPLSSFRCFEYGVVCDGDGDPRQPGPRTGCRPRSDSPLIAPIEPYAAFLTGLKENPQQVIAAAIIGDAANVVVGRGAMDEPIVEVSCESPLGEAAPAVRTQAFLDLFPSRSATSSICQGELSFAMERTGQIAADVAGRSPCLAGTIADVDADASGVQPACRAYWEDGDAIIDIPRCGEGSSECFDIVLDRAACPSTASGLAVTASGSIRANLAVDCRLAAP